MKIKIFIIALIAALLVACNSEESIDVESSATGEYNQEEVTEADKQFGKLKNNNNKSSEQTEDIKTVRPDVTKFILEQFDVENSYTKELNGLEYTINDKSITSIFKGEATHKFQNAAYPYSIEIKCFDKKISNSDFVNTIKKDYPNLKVLNMKPYGDVLLENINNNPYSAELHVLWNNENSYYIVFKSETMSVPEILVLSEKFAEYLK